ncbi:MAG TPA: hypothetical protein VH092_09090 [Urbifossiella sp.]|jgi:hypothetical protein|nr:hypothetical protein [Urbifossiella sp.]
MPITILRGKTDEVIDAIVAALRSYDESHPDASIEVYRQNSVSIRIRVIDPSFHTLSRTDRSKQIWPLLRTLPEETLQEISFVILIAPGEKISSMSSREFDDPIPSSIR